MICNKNGEKALKMRNDCGILVVRNIVYCTMLQLALKNLTKENVYEPRITAKRGN